MTQFTNATFSVGGKHCNGCSQRDVWIEQRNEEIGKLRDALEIIANDKNPSDYSISYLHSENVKIAREVLEP